MTSISDIAKKVSVAKSTVSRVLNNHPHVSDKTKEKVMAAIAELDYSPNQVARDLSRGKTMKIGVVIPHTRHPYFTQLINGLLDAAKESHYQLVMMPSNYDHELEISYLEQLRHAAIDALIFTSREISVDVIEGYAKYGRIVLLEDLKGHNLLSSAFVDRYWAYLGIFTQLKEQKLTNPALLFTRNNPDSATYRTAMAAYEAVFGEREPLTFGGVNTYEDGYAVVEQLLAAPRKIDVVIANSDNMAAGILDGYQDKQVTAPLVIGQDRQLVSKLLGLITIDHKSYQLGKLAFEQVLSEEVSQKWLKSEVIRPDKG